jgi:hypothetical protein
MDSKVEELMEFYMEALIDYELLIYKELKQDSVDVDFKKRVQNSFGKFEQRLNSDVTNSWSTAGLDSKENQHLYA